MLIIECAWVWLFCLLLIYKMKFKNNNITIVIKKNMITEFFNDKLNNFIFTTYKFLKKNKIFFSMMYIRAIYKSIYFKKKRDFSMVV